VIDVIGGFPLISLFLELWVFSPPTLNSVYLCSKLRALVALLNMLYQFRISDAYQQGSQASWTSVSMGG
jgi:hypothetical protein